ncbi:MAG: AtpZ/AtpI family protein [Acidobacteriota bacterium]|nr:MAG: AtpZ/AtpI family protein [Acidobacteriota bacterium]
MKPTKLALAFSVGAMITSNIVGGIIVGYLLDRYFETEPAMIVTGLILGTIGAFAGLYRIMSRLSGSDEN